MTTATVSAASLDRFSSPKPLKTRSRPLSRRSITNSVPLVFEFCDDLPSFLLASNLNPQAEPGHKELAIFFVDPQGAGSRSFSRSRVFWSWFHSRIHLSRRLGAHIIAVVHNFVRNGPASLAVTPTNPASRVPRGIHRNDGIWALRIGQNFWR